MTDDFLLEIKVKNNRILSRIKQQGFSSLHTFCKTYQIGYRHAVEIVSFRTSPKDRNGEWREVVYDLSSALHCEPEDFFSETQLTMLAGKSVAHIEIGEQEINRYLDSKHLARRLLTCLTPREKQIIEERYFDNASREEVGDREGITNCRIMQLEFRALNKMQRLAKKDDYLQREAIAKWKKDKNG